jgi:hypothetical protein
MGEAALAGVPIVCTDVGASFRVVTNPVTWKRFSAVVGPNDPHSLARAQINVLGLLDEWSEYAEDEPGCRPKLSLRPSPEEVAMITERMYAKTEQRRRLGMLGRENVLSSFSGDRYLREHEQMLWIGKHCSPSYRSRTMPSTSPSESTYLNPSGEKIGMDETDIPSSDGNTPGDYTPGYYTSAKTLDFSVGYAQTIDIVIDRT